MINEKFSSESVKAIKDLTDELRNEKTKEKPDNAKILKLHQRILMKGIAMSAGFNIDNYNPYR